MQLNQDEHTSIKWFVTLAVLLAFLLAAGCDRRQQAPPPPPVPQVTTVTVQPEQVILSSQLPGRTSAFRVAEIRPQINGLIQQRLFTEGSTVEPGEVLYQIDPAPFQAALDNANAALARAEANLSSVRAKAERFKELVADNAVSRQDYEDAEAALTGVTADIQYWKAMVETARINLDYTRITAPIGGRIGKSNVTDGAIVTAYQPLALATIQQLDPIYVDMPQSTTDLLRLKRRLKEGLLNRHEEGHNEVDLILEDGTPYSLEGTLQFSDVTVDPTTGSVTLRALFPNPEDVLLPGMFVQAVIREGANEQAILIPQQGVSRDPKGNPFALVVDADSKAAFRPLTLDRAVDDKWLVSEGLAPGDRVIIEGMLMLRPGSEVQAAPFDAAPAEQGAGSAADSSPEKEAEGDE
ncbi:MAG: efflux RND transporter periplasmic adaptor subunit [Desulfobulbaceae bacterium]|nr:efflux RND transporter periplasmic adaptor subunit [Desulfobulbaceae bacterium]